MNLNRFNRLVNIIISLLNKTNGRDKIYRVLQYFFKFMSSRTISHLKKLNLENSDKLVIYKNISNTMSMARKLFRFGKHFGLFKNMNINIGHLINNKDKKSISSSKIFIFLKLMASINLSLYYFTDHILYFNKIGFINNPGLVFIVDYFSLLFWLFESLFSFIANIVELSHNITEIKSTDSDDIHRKNFMIRNNQITADLTRLIFDIPICIGFIAKGTMKNEVIGILGTISSIVGIYQNLD